MTNNSTHTPGPWHVWHGSMGHRTIRSGDPLTEADSVAVIESNNADSDARLIAAAPEMYELLQDVTSVGWYSRVTALLNSLNPTHERT